MPDVDIDALDPAGKPDEPWDEEYVVLQAALSQARKARVELGLLAAFETEIPGYEPQTVDQVVFGPRIPKRARGGQPFGHDLEVRLAAADLQVALLQERLDGWEAAQATWQAWKDAQANTAVIDETDAEAA